MRLGHNFIWQFLGQGVAKGLGLLFFLLLPRWTGLELYGQFTFALALGLMILQPLLELGLDLVVTKWVSRNQPGVIQNALWIRLGMAGVCGLLLPLLATLGSALSLLAVLYLYLVLLSIQRLCFAVQRGYEQMRLEAIANVIHKGLAVLLLAGLYWLKLPSLWLGPMALVAATAIATFLAWVYTWPHIKPTLEQPLDLKQVRQTATEGVLLGGVVLLGMLYFRIDTVMLGLLQGDEAVGLYNLAYKLIEGTIMLPSVILIVTFPRLAQPAKFSRMFRNLFGVLGISGLVVCGAMVLSSAWLVTTIYGTDFQGAIAILQLLSFTLIPIYWGHLATQSLVALDQQKLYLLLTLAAVGLNVGLNAWLIPSYSAQGAAIATIITESLMTLSCFVGVWWVRFRQRLIA